MAVIEGNGDIVFQNRSINANFRGTTASYQEVSNHYVREGRFFSDAENSSIANVAVLGAEMKEELFPLSSPLNEKIKINNQTFKVIGVLEKKGTSAIQNYDNQVIIPLLTAQKELLGVNHVGLIRAKVDSEKNTSVTEQRVTELIRKRHNILNPDNDDFSVRSLSQALDVLTTVTDGIRFFLASIAAISLIVGGIGIMNIMLMIVKERTREIGLRKAIGAKPRHIKNQFIIEALVVTVSGGIIGILSGIILSFLIALGINYVGYDWKFIFPPSSAVISFSVAFLIGVIFGYYPAKQAAELNPIEALRYE